MRVLLVNPKQSLSLHTYTEVGDITGRPGWMPNLALPTLAALAPSGVDVTIVDENVEPIDFDATADVVGITGYYVHRRRMIEIAREFRQRGQLVAMGGPYASLSPATLREHCDVLFIGEAEDTWPRFLADLQSGTHQAEYRATETVDIAASPMPRLSDMSRERYAFGVVQTSRGCPFECEFCDVIIYLGRKQRYKQPARVVAELEQLYRAGFRSIFISDDNFTANRARAKDIMTAVRDWHRAQAEEVYLITQISVEVTRDEELLALCGEAGLAFAFVGVESSDVEALRSVKKNQNVRVDLVADLQKFYKHGIGVTAGMITGFDTDTRAVFKAQFDFASAAGIPIVTASMLNAPTGTPLEARLRAENRLIASGDHDPYMFTNILPKQMSRKELILGTQWLLNRLYAPKIFLERVRHFASFLPPPTTAAARISEAALQESARAWNRLLKSYAAMGPEFAQLPLRAALGFRGKSAKHLVSVLIWYKHIVTVLRRWEVWSPELGALPEPAFDRHVVDVPLEGIAGAGGVPAARAAAAGAD